MINIVPCGGSGSRLWPLSRKCYPKQFNKFIDNESLFEKTLKRNNELCDKRIIVTNETQYDLALAQSNNMNIKNNEFILEPIGRSTAAAATLACLTLEDHEVVLITPADHLINDEKEYYRIIKQAEKPVNEGFLVTFGIRPDSPDTNYGYIEADGNDVLSFKEKPDIKTAAEYISKGNYYWNSGMFAFKVETFLKELQKYDQEVYHFSNEAYLNSSKKSPVRIEEEDMIKIPSISIDYSVMEKNNKLKVIPSDIGWSDLGSFEALYKHLDKDENGNMILSDKVLIENSDSNLIISENRIISTIDIDNLIIVDIEGALLISRYGSSHKIKDVTKGLDHPQKSTDEVSGVTYRPWGNFISLEEGYRFKVKKLSINPGGRLSLQKHFHRNEHWTVVNGTAKVTLEDREVILDSNDSIYIPLGQLHRVENPGKIQLVIIETQVGDYLEEDDIVRIEDDYNRINSRKVERE